MLASCYKPYSPGIEANDRILVVEGMVTNELASYVVNLGYALPFDSKSQKLRVTSANVSVTDDLNNTYLFRERKSGSYYSDSLKFSGIPGRTYKLRIETSDGEIFESEPQRVEIRFYPDSIYAEVDYQESISRFNQRVVTVRGANIMADIRGHDDTLPHFRFTSDLVEQYFYALYIPPEMIDPPLYSFYCWQTDNSSSGVNIVNRDYSSNSTSVTRHEIYFLNEHTNVNGIVYGLGKKKPDQSFTSVATANRQSYTVAHRILYLNQYTLNSQSYEYYKKIDVLLRSEGKLFDPIASQLQGNLRCISDSTLKVFGFFEASAVSRTAYLVGFRNARDQYPITKIPYKLPVSRNGCMIDKVPPFWVP